MAEHGVENLSVGISRINVVSWDNTFISASLMLAMVRCALGHCLGLSVKSVDWLWSGRRTTGNKMLCLINVE